MSDPFEKFLELRKFEESAIRSVDPFDTTASDTALRETQQESPSQSLPEIFRSGIVAGGEGLAAGTQYFGALVDTLQGDAEMGEGVVE